jgi:hypothetical protein
MVFGKYLNGKNLKGWVKRKSSKFTVNVHNITKSRKLQLVEKKNKHEVTFHMMTSEKRPQKFETLSNNDFF